VLPLLSPTPSGLLAVVVATALGAARLVPVIWLVTPLGGPRLPAAVRVGFALLLALVAAPVLVASPGAGALADASPSQLALLLAREIAVGFCLGLVASAAFRAAEIAGRLGDTLRGANVAEILVPTADERASPLGVLYVLLATVVFLQIGGVPRLVEALLASYRTLPIAGPIAGGLGEPAVRRAALVVVAASAKLIASGLALAAPVVVALWLTDLALGLIARAAPSVPVYFLGLPLKGLLAIGVVLLGLAMLQASVARGFASWMHLLSQAVAALRG
jgi:flagellar biosynthetic protein FliR